jgi:cellulose synthase/poly-beta-1,6-N-acetylglucosamine synthase-like glycosyltransferase
LREATGELIAVFDADFVPAPSFLHETVPYFADPGVGMVQARWGHVNAQYSLLTRVQAVLLDGHFVLEHGGRNRAGCFFNFNGTAGVWRRRVEEAGGWQHDTLTEDMDLSYRAQLVGFRFVFLPDVVVPAELPVSMSAFKSQQHRWSKGSIQTARKLLPRILASPISRKVKLESLFHLTANLSYPLMVLLSLLMFPSMLLRFNMGLSEMLIFDLPLFLLATASVTSFYVVSQREIYPDWKARLRVLPMLLALGIGMCVNNARAVLEALLGRETEFVRTPKYGIESSDEEWRLKKYRGLTSFLPLVEVGLGLYFMATVVFAASRGVYVSLPFLFLFQAGFLYTGVLSLRERFDRPPPLVGTARALELRG